MMPKFRGWRKTAQKMVNVSSLDWKIDENEKEYLSAIWWYSTQNALVSSADDVSDDFILMQSTGLKDKNGKEIFEADVVVVLDGMYTVFYDEKTASFRLKPHDKRWHTDYMSNYAHSGSFEVVGNVYQNSELIEEANNVVD